MNSNARHLPLGADTLPYLRTGALRMPKQTIERQAVLGQIPGRKIEDTWRFLRAAINEWLRAQDSRTVLLQQADVFADDDTLPRLREAMYAARGRAESEDNC